MSQRAKFTRSHFTKSHFNKLHHGHGGKVIKISSAKKSSPSPDPLKSDVEREITKLRISFILADTVFIAVVFYIIFRN